MQVKYLTAYNSIFLQKEYCPVVKKARNLLLVLVLVSYSTFSSLPAWAKSLVLIGGGTKEALGSSGDRNSAAIFKRIIELSGGPRVAKIGIVTAASVPPSQDNKAGTSDASNSRDNGAYYAKEFKGLGAADAQWIPIDLDSISNNSSQAVVNQVNSMTGFFFGGGDQSRLITCLLKRDRTDSPVLAAIRKKFAQGAAIAGSSAGTDIQAGGTYLRDSSKKIPMVTGGESYEALKNGLHTSVRGSDLSYDPQGGFGFFRYGALDTHFAERGRQGRLVRLAWGTYMSDAYAPDENTALVVTDADTPNAKMSAIGQGGVNIFDLSSASQSSRACSSASSSEWKLCGVKYTYLTQDDRYDPATRTVTIATWKSSLTGKENHSNAKSHSEDIFSSPNNLNSSDRRQKPREFINIANDLFDSRSTSTYGLTYESRPTFKVTLTKDKSSGSTGYYGTTLTGEKFYSFKNLLLDFLSY